MHPVLSSKAAKALHLVPIAFTRPLEFYDRIHAVVQVHKQCSTQRSEYQALAMNDACRILEAATGREIRPHLQDGALVEFEAGMRRRWAELADSGPFNHVHNGDHRLARTCYAVVRGLTPKIAVETGVCYGVTSSYLLQAMEQNGRGELHSIDLPPLAKEADSYVGRLVPDRLRHRWTLHRGNAQRLLPPLLRDLGEIDLFFHDSLHTYEHMKIEFKYAWAALCPGGVLISDDVEGNTAFLEQCSAPDVRASVVMRFSEGDALFGVAVKE